MTERITEKIGLSKWSILAALTLLIPSYLFNGWICWKIWRWIIVPLGVPMITYWHCVGVGLVVKYAVSGRGALKIESDLDYWSKCIAALVIDLLMVFSFWIIHLLMIA